MAHTAAANTATSSGSTYAARRLLLSRSGRTSMLLAAAGGGLAVGIFASLAVTMPMVRSEAAQNKALSQKVVSMKPANDFTSDVCVQPGGLGGAEVTPAPAGAVLGANVTAPVVTPPSGGAGGGSQSFVKQLVGGNLTNRATITNTGPESSNKITEVNKVTTTVTNHNDISVTNTNDQSASSGDATVENNTNAGTASSGDATNSNSTNLSINITNQ